MLEQLPREVVESLSLEVCRNRGDVALRDVTGHGGDGLIAWLNGLSNLNESMML